MGSTFITSARRILEDRTTATVDNHTMAPAAVLLALYPVDGELCVVLQKRSEHVEHHKGEISFPGGMADPDDESRLSTALREAHEEMGIDPADVQVIGRLDDTPTVTDFMISTFVGAIPPNYSFKLASVEVAEALEVPISHLRDPASSRCETRLLGDRPVTFPTFVYDGHVIFGATAKILDQFLKLTGDLPL